MRGADAIRLRRRVVQRRAALARRAGVRPSAMTASVSVPFDARIVAVGGHLHGGNGKRFSVRFTRAGRYELFCSLHPLSN
jgi:hypothetical protein